MKSKFQNFDFGDSAVCLNRLLILLPSMMLLYATASVGQIVVSKNTDNQTISTYTYDYSGKYVSSHTEQYKGSPFLGDAAWHRGQLVYPNGATQAVFLSLNIFSNTLRCLLDDSTEVATDKIEKFQFEDKLFVQKRTSLNVKYYELLIDGEVQFLKSYKQQLSKTPSNLLIGKDAFGFDGEFKPSENYYVKFANRPIQEVLLNQKSIFRLFPNARNCLKTNTHKNRLNEVELSQFIACYNQQVVLKSISVE